MISERTLRKWRRVALTVANNTEKEDRGSAGYVLAIYVLALTQELLDQHLLKK